MGVAQPPPSLEQGLTARPPQPLPHCRFRKEKLNLWVPAEAVFSSSPASTSFPPIWAQAASTFARSGGAPDASITQKVCPLLLLRAYVFTCSQMHCEDLYVLTCTLLVHCQHLQISWWHVLNVSRMSHRLIWLRSAKQLLPN